MLAALVLGAAGAPVGVRAQADSTAAGEQRGGDRSVALPTLEPGENAELVAPSLRGPRIPGTSLRLGDSAAVARLGPDLRTVSDPDLAPGEVAYGGTVRFYGSPGSARLVFREGVLIRAAFSLKHASSRTRAYVEDDLRRLGYRADCRRTGADDRDCDWIGPLSATVRADTALLSAEFGAPGMLRESTPSGGPDLRATGRSLQAALASDTTPILPDTLDLREDHPEYSKPVLVKSALARIPDDLRGATERGLVTVMALVSAEGQVVYAQAVAGPEALRPVSVGAVMQYRFQRYVTREGRRRFWVRVSVYPA
jgi:hypothetical protein